MGWRMSALDDIVANAVCLGAQTWSSTLVVQDCQPHGMHWSKKREVDGKIAPNPVPVSRLLPRFRFSHIPSFCPFFPSQIHARNMCHFQLP